MSGYNFTDRIREVLRLAREEAIRLKHEYVGTEHIVLGLIHEGEGVGAAILTNLNVDSHLVRQEVEKRLKKGRRTLTSGSDLPYTSRAKQVLQLSMDEAHQLGLDYVDTGVLLLGLLREGKGIAGQVLEGLGLKLTEARAELLRLIRARPANPSISPEENHVPTVEGYPGYEQLRETVRHLALRADRFTIVADLDSLPPEVLVNLMAGLDALHRAWGGSGLRVEAEHCGSTVAERVTV